MDRTIENFQNKTATQLKIPAIFGEADKQRERSDSARQKSDGKRRLVDANICTQSPWPSDNLKMKFVVGFRI